MSSVTTASLERPSAQLLRSDESVTTTRVLHRQLTPREYANTVDSYSKLSSVDSLYPGSNFASLATFLLQAYLSHPSNLDLSTLKSRQPVGQDHSFVIHCDLKNGGAGRSREFRSASELLAFEGHSIREPGSASLLFLRGYPSPEWLNTIGAKFSIDPEFFRRHLDFRNAGGTSSSDFSLPTLPSATFNMTRLRINTLASRLDNWRASNQRLQGDLDRLREETAASFHEYLTAIRRGRDVDVWTGDSIVRAFSILNHEYLSIEQDISIYVESLESSIFAMVWLDVSNDLSQTSPGPWNCGSLNSQRYLVNYLPTIQLNPFAALRFHNKASHIARSNAAASKIPQSAALLHLDYARHLDPEMAIADRFFALKDIFCFAAFSESQFLNAVQSTVDIELDPTTLPHQKDPSISNLLHIKNILERHITRLKENIVFISNFRDPQLIHPLSDQSLEKSRSTVKALLQDFHQLLEQAQSLRTQCDRGMDIVMNNTVILESRDAMAQNKKVAKLTRLAFFFIPLSLTTSFFGMNFTELNSGSLMSVWVWFVATAPVLMVSIVFLVWDMEEAWNGARTAMRKRGEVKWREQGGRKVGVGA